MFVVHPLFQTVEAERLAAESTDVKFDWGQILDSASLDVAEEVVRVIVLPYECSASFVFVHGELAVDPHADVREGTDLSAHAAALRTHRDPRRGPPPWTSSWV
eukprot:6697864-Pyramimonas_sp.AAC.1